MQQRKPFTFAARLGSFRFALRGIGVMLASQHNAWIHAAATCLVAAAAWWLNISPLEWCVIVLAMVAVWTAEALNTALELLTDIASPMSHPVAEKAKDVAAGAVLIAAAGAAVVGLIVLLPYVMNRLGDATQLAP